MANVITQYISVKEYANYIGKTTQQVYNLIRCDAVSAIQFNRGKMVGYLIEKPIDYDERMRIKQ